jgi:anaerobic selenocysteine-containing dehydrogenase
VRVFNDSGAFIVRARISADIARGVVATPIGEWRKHAAAAATVNAVNSFTVADLGHAPMYYDTRVDVEPWSSAEPPGDNGEV